jgi:preprotein translocase subunit SecG
MNYLLAVPNWVANSFPIIKFILLLAILVISLAITILVLFQESEGGNTTNSLTGIKDTYYSKNKGMGRDARLKRATIILSIAISVLIVAYLILAKIYGGSIWS